MAPSLPVAASACCPRVLRGLARGASICTLVLGLLCVSVARAEAPSPATTPGAEDNRLGLEILAGAGGAVLMVIPGTLIGHRLGFSRNDLGCTHGEGVCSTQVGLTLGAMSGATLGATLGVWMAGSSHGGYGSLLITLGGAAVGSLVGLPSAFNEDDTLKLMLLPTLGSFLGALLAYEISDSALRPSVTLWSRAAEAGATPTVALLPGGGLVGLVGRF